MSSAGVTLDLVVFVKWPVLVPRQPGAAAAASRGASRRSRTAAAGVEVVACAADPAQPQPCVSYFSLVDVGDKRGGCVDTGHC